MYKRQVITGLLSAELEPNKTMENPYVSYQLTYGFSIVLFGSSSAESNPVITCQISRV